MEYSSSTVVSMNEPTSEGGEERGAFIKGDDEKDVYKSLNEYLNKKGLNKILDFLSPDQRKIIEMRFGINISKPLEVSEIGRLYGVTRQAMDLRIKAAMDILQRVAPYAILYGKKLAK